MTGSSGIACICNEEGEEEDKEGRTRTSEKTNVLNGNKTEFDIIQKWEKTDGLNGNKKKFDKKK